AGQPWSAGPDPPASACGLSFKTHRVHPVHEVAYQSLTKTPQVLSLEMGCFLLPIFAGDVPRVGMTERSCVLGGVRCRL
ncbi:hypothetical protein DSK68_19405, partial [Mycobacterium tuberculosis]